jgi:membrane protein
MRWSVLTGSIRGAAGEFFEDRAMAHAAAVAFYTALSFAPLVLLFVTIGGFLGESTTNELISFFERQLGPEAAEVTDTVLAQASKPTEETNWWRMAWSIGMLLFTASAVFAQLQSSLNHVWDVRAVPGRGIWRFIRKRLLSMGIIFAVLFILLVALVVSAVIEKVVPSGDAVAGRVLSFVMSLAVFTLLFAAIYKILPDVRIRWSEVWFGASVTALLFTLGKLGISLYLQHSTVVDQYGSAAGSMIALLVWVYYSCILLFVGAELTEQYVRQRGGLIEPSAHARRTERGRAAGSGSG